MHSKLLGMYPDRPGYAHNEPTQTTRQPGAMMWVSGVGEVQLQRCKIRQETSLMEGDYPKSNCLTVIYTCIILIVQA